MTACVSIDMEAMAAAAAVVVAPPDDRGGGMMRAGTERAVEMVTMLLIMEVAQGCWGSC